MKVSAFALATLLASASITTASAFDQCTSHAYQDNLRTGTFSKLRSSTQPEVSSAASHLAPLAACLMLPAAQ